MLRPENPPTDALPRIDLADESTYDGHKASENGRTRPRAALAALLFIVFMVCMSLQLVILPVSRIIEARYCLEYYAVHDPSLIGEDGQVPESECKIAVVQESLGWMAGALQTITLACDILSATPLAYFADRIGRRRVIFLNLTAMAVRLLWIAFVGQTTGVAIHFMLLAPFLGIYGGGSVVNTSILLAIVSDVAQSESQRTIYMSWVNSLVFVTTLVGPSLAALLMEQALWLPIWIGIAMLFVSMPLITFLPQAKDTKSIRLSRRSSVESVAETADLLNTTDQNADEQFRNEAPTHNQSTAQAISNFFRSYLRLVTSSRQIKLLLLSFFLVGFASASSTLFPLYLTTRYGWTFAQIGVIFSFKAIVNLVMSLVIVPAFSTYMAAKSSPDRSQTRADMLGAKVALVISIIGVIMVGVSNARWIAILSLCVYAVGSVLGVFMFSLSRASDLDVFDESNEAKGFTMTVLVHSLGGLIGTPTMTTIWVKVIAVGGSSIGLPFFVSAVAYTACLFVFRRLTR